MMPLEKPNPFPVLLPDSLILGQLAAAMSIFIKATAWEIGERFQAIIGHRCGDDWLVETYGAYRTPQLHDPDFIFQLHPRDSILWEALPPFSVDLQDRFGKARATRNRWEHETALQTMNSFLNGVDHINRLTQPLGLKTKEYAPVLIDRIRTLQRAGGVLPASEAELELEREREGAEEARRAAQEAVEHAAAAVAAAEEKGAAAAEALEAREQALARAAAAQSEIERLEAELLAAAASTRRAVTEPADGLEPGAPWGDLPLGVRVLTLKKNMVDLMDTATQTLLSQQIGAPAREAARRWLLVMPSGGQVHLTPAGHAAGHVGGRYLYLGRLDDPAG
jgi:hypothetical protein